MGKIKVCRRNLQAQVKIILEQISYRQLSYQDKQVSAEEHLYFKHDKHYFEFQF